MREEATGAQEWPQRVRLGSWETPSLASPAVGLGREGVSVQFLTVIQ